ncbi:1-acyl-sn-glycerol-3-phosphate acyltransferase [Flavobacterium sp. MAH-1]|uniref:1-acyl-sn-glycerol-3-phosphate acyltransferase n=1 Tax=Flavobacterium agri TaxID=2743471 RepID=A0A7Y8Y2M4_9FLAO|nr:1-acyl-sn-glycerol-3-phosphate acyltransferase [Flavobacterium agri]NUY81399.1 1-acyl-sn-glycerol-3-phosphate acyltransferase [Flavobacterium agri]NYA71423.1 1-acyl-sn-glycerol-3-phosphate acyltransferase [Flavobacterium agri]
MHRFFFGIHQFVNRNKFVSVAIALGILCIFGFFGSRLKFEEDVTKLLPVNDKLDVTAKVLKQVNFADKITVIFESKPNGSPEDLQQTAQVFIDSLEKSCKPFYKEIQGKIAEENIDETIGFVFDNLPLFLNETDYAQIDSKLSQDSIKATVEANYRSMLSPSGMVTGDFIRRDPLGISFIGLKKLQQLSLGDDFTLENGFVMTKDKKMLLLFIAPNQSSAEADKNAEFSKKLYEIKGKLDSSKTTKVSYFGSPLIAVANATQIKGDVMLTTILAMSALMLILILFYRKITIPIIIFIPTIFGALFALTVLYFVKETISAISLGIGAILIGITIDYSLHILTHYKHNVDVKHTYEIITKPLFMSSSTTALAFLCLLFVKSEALRDLGIFAASIVMGSAFFSLLIVPHLYKPNKDVTAHKENFIERAAGFSFDSNKWLILGCAILVVISIFTSKKVDFDNDLSKLNYIPEDIRQAEKQLEKNSSLTSKTIYVAAYGNSLDAALASNSKLFSDLESDKKSGKILNFSSIGGLVLPVSQQQQKIDRWNSFWTPEKKSALRSKLISEGEKVGFKANTYEPFFEELNKNFEPVPIHELNKVAALQLGEFIAHKNDFYTVSTLVKVSNGQRDAFVKSAATKKNVVAIDRQEMNETFLTQLRDDFNNLVDYSLIAVVAILFVFFRRIEIVLVATIPIVLTGLVTAGVMGIFGLELNIFSTIVCTLIFGHGVDFSIFMTSALQKEYTDGRDERKVYRTSIILAAITTILGVGALIFAGHPSLKSISTAALIGVFAACAMIFVLYPMIFRWVFFARRKKGFAPIQLRRMLHSFFSLAYYAIGGFFISIFAWLMMKLLPLSKRRKQKIFHRIMSGYMNSVFYTFPAVTRRIYNEQNEDFSKPAVIIANHTSFLDTMAMGGLNGNIIFLVSDHVYNNPIIGLGVRLAGFYPASEGLKTGVEHLREKVNQGFSLMIFPEGTRSEDNSIKRFKKGAFFLAQEFDLDILPVLIQGYSEAAPKNDFILNGTTTAIKFLPRIKPDDLSFGKDYAERTKKVNAYMRDEFQKLRAAEEGPKYWKKFVLGSFDFKEEFVVSAVKSDLNANMELYHRLNKHIGIKSKMLHVADDYGQLDVLLAFQQSTRRIDSYIADDETRRIANQSHVLQKREITYISKPEKRYETLLISAKRVETEAVARLSDHVILLDNDAFVEIFENLGFKTIHTEQKITILKREAAV